MEVRSPNHPLERTSPCDAAGMERLTAESGRQMSEASAEFLPPRLAAVEWRVSGIAVGNGGQGAGRVFLHTLLSRDKRVWRRTGPQPRDLDFASKVLKVFGVNKYDSLRNEKHRRVSSRQTRHFSASGQKSPQKTPPQCLQPLPWQPAFHNHFRAAPMRYA